MNETSELLVSLFILTHCLLSTLLFFTIDILIKRFHTRIVTNITGIIQVMPLFGLCMITTLLLFTGLPFTIKFFLEINIFNLLLNFNIELTILIIFIAN
jgi:formate hydrogenlyase subunit 3/multisubunit Na+/H+ antiporter MnhD subunit